ncbi:alpha- and gamma-adaptin-binding protein p34-like [Tribolium madens]|uniref:alpha- and gamma-adaptin-binding protein p34-like n=1 Tax=Tribolium madens TaxID=41895 RepID=UPI001CF721F4|nr:alpha- and gamma-adaptin-binding protein p34-like [Tribolium madens]
MSGKPSVVIVSSSSTKPKSLIKLITKCADIQEDPLDSNRITHTWTIDTKYYSAEVDVIGITEQYERSQTFNDNVEALVIHIDTNKESGLKDLDTWTSLQEECDPEIKLLIANYCTSETKTTKAAATEWCLKHGFELIELYPGSQICDQDIIEEKIGVERVIEALQTHTWTNLNMKNQENDVNKKNDSVVELCEEFLTSEAVDDFSDLFAQLNMMKESLQSLPMNQRKQCAEQVVTAFWRAIGGDEEEIADV